jgi:hypothetical protein
LASADDFSMKVSLVNGTPLNRPDVGVKTMDPLFGGSMNRFAAPAAWHRPEGVHLPDL